MHMPLTEATDLAQLVQARRQHALGQLSAAAGNASLCTLSRAGTPRPAVKYHEGAVAALSEIHRSLTGSPANRAATDSAIADVRERWLTRAERSAPSPAWQAYLDGALDTLEGLEDMIAQHTDVPSMPDPAPEPEPGTTVSAGQNPEHPLAAAPSKGAWPRRRTVATVALTPVVFLVLIAAGEGWALAQAPLWTAIVALVAATAAATLATYLPLPGQGWRVNLGCSPCAAMSAMTILVAAGLLAAAPQQASLAVVALLAAGFGLVQRLTQAGASCRT